MAPLAVDPGALDSAGAQVVTVGEGLGSVISTLTAALSGCSGMAGNDPVGMAFGHSYDGSATKLFQAMAATRNGLCGLGYGVRMSAHNYSLAEAQSNISGHGNPLPSPPAPSPISASSAPTSIGSGDGPPAGWGWVAPFIGMIWPTGDSGKLRAASAAWSTAGTQFGVAEIVGTGAPMGAVRAQQIPEGPAIDKAFTAAYTATTGIVQLSQKIAAQLNSYAAKVDKVHAAILDLLSRICDPTTGFKEVWDILTDEDEDEIKKIADDIRTVVNNFASEVSALEAEIAATLSEAATIVTTMGDYATKQWDQFLHGTDVGRAINQVGQYAKGVYAEAGGLVKGLYDISQIRLLLDPMGYFRDLGQMAQGAAPLVGLGPDGGPGVGESWKTLGKGLVHWDEWEKNPAEAAGRSVFDLATLLIPGGPLSKLPKMSRAAADALKSLKKPPIPKLPEPPSIKPPTAEPPPAAPKPTESGPKPPEPGRPAPAPPPKPASGPGEGPLPHSPTETKPPVEGPPKPAAAPPVSVPAESVPAPHPHEPVPVAAAPHGAPAEPHPGAALPAPAASAPSLPSVPSIPSIPSIPELPSIPEVPTSPTGSLPGEATPPGGGLPHGGDPGGGAPHGPGDGGPHGPGDGGPPSGPPHGPGDGPPHGPGDSKDPNHPGDGDGSHHPGDSDGDGTPGDHGHHHGDEPPKARDVFPNAKEYGDLTEDEYRKQFEDANGNLRYPDADDPAKPYAVPGTVHNLAPTEIQALDGQKLSRIGYPGGEWLAPLDSPYEGRSLPHTSLDKPYYVYTVHAEVGLPPGWKIELSRASAWFGHPGGEPQYFLIAPKDAEASVEELLDTGFLTED
jgi:Tuberculosis necrotizing toxin